MVTADEALKAFESGGKVEEVKAPILTATPSIKMHDEDGKNVGAFVHGKYLTRRASQGTNGEVVYFDLKLIQTNAKATIKKGDTYVTADVKTGDIVSLFASKRLDRQLSVLEPGKEFIAVYKGMIRVKSRRGGKVSAHDFDVKAKGDAALLPEEIEYIKQRSDKKVDTTAETTKADREAMANLDSLDD